MGVCVGHLYFRVISDSKFSSKMITAAESIDIPMSARTIRQQEVSLSSSEAVVESHARRSNRARIVPAKLRAERAKRRKNSSEIAPPPPPPPIEQIDNHPTTIPCDKCRLDILHTADRVVCRPCNHTLCSACAFKTHVKRGCKPFTCPITNCLQCYSTAFDYVNENGRENINNPPIHDKS